MPQPWPWARALAPPAQLKPQLEQRVWACAATGMLCGLGEKHALCTAGSYVQNGGDSSNFMQGGRESKRQQESKGTW